MRQRYSKAVGLLLLRCALGPLVARGWILSLSSSSSLYTEKCSLQKQFSTIRSHQQGQSCCRCRRCRCRCGCGSREKEICHAFVRFSVLSGSEQDLNVPEYNNKDEAEEDGDRTKVKAEKVRNDAPLSASSLSWMKQRPHKQQQLWLDLRDTAIRPNEAFTILQQFVLDNDGNKQQQQQQQQQHSAISEWVDRILVPEETFVHMVQQSGTSNRVLLLVTSDGKLVENCQATQQSVLRGKVLVPSNRGLLDPLVALEMKEGWVLIDSNRATAGTVSPMMMLLVDQVDGLAQLLVANPRSAAVHDDEMACSSSSSSSSSGLAIVCSTREVLLAMDRVLTAHQIRSRGTQQTESGILVVVDQDAATTGQFVLSTALVLPLDVDLWRIALQLRRPIVDDDTNPSDVDV